eukprot:CAMPEP_0174828850 /NCGR_PEP_ID=MMETSP1114-20130205/1568_1 /TAXON_ID=312471 /ORGANISM="Neobodo designis, Strain CCAP 1951/1" /LENGTH=2956 /DNA_ID=CAMNT_0016062577 /DNA_START=8 /DNA_END=8879 /DNA_ORIENTATION=+
MAFSGAHTRGGRRSGSPGCKESTPGTRPAVAQRAGASQTINGQVTVWHDALRAMEIESEVGTPQRWAGGEAAAGGDTQARNPRAGGYRQAAAGMPPRTEGLKSARRHAADRLKRQQRCIGPELATGGSAPGGCPRRRKIEKTDRRYGGKVGAGEYADASRCSNNQLLRAVRAPRAAGRRFSVGSHRSGLVAPSADTTTPARTQTGRVPDRQALAANISRAVRPTSSHEEIDSADTILEEVGVLVAVARVVDDGRGVALVRVVLVVLARRLEEVEVAGVREVQAVQDHAEQDEDDGQEEPQPPHVRVHLLLAVVEDRRRVLLRVRELAALAGVPDAGLERSDVLAGLAVALVAVRRALGGAAGLGADEEEAVVERVARRRGHVGVARREHARPALEQAALVGEARLQALLRGAAAVLAAAARGVPAAGVGGIAVALVGVLDAGARDAHLVRRGRLPHAARVAPALARSRVPAKALGARAGGPLAAGVGEARRLGGVATAASDGAEAGGALLHVQERRVPAAEAVARAPVGGGVHGALARRGGDAHAHVVVPVAARELAARAEAAAGGAADVTGADPIVPAALRVVTALQHGERLALADEAAGGLRDARDADVVLRVEAVVHADDALLVRHVGDGLPVARRLRVHVRAGRRRLVEVPLGEEVLRGVRGRRRVHDRLRQEARAVPEQLAGTVRQAPAELALRVRRRGEPTGGAGLTEALLVDLVAHRGEGAGHVEQRAGGAVSLRLGEGRGRGVGEPLEVEAGAGGVDGVRAHGVRDAARVGAAGGGREAHGLRHEEPHVGGNDGHVGGDVAAQDALGAVVGPLVVHGVVGGDGEGQLVHVRLEAAGDGDDEAVDDGARVAVGRDAAERHDGALVGRELDGVAVRGVVPQAAVAVGGAQLLARELAVLVDARRRVVIPAAARDVAAFADGVEGAAAALDAARTVPHARVVLNAVSLLERGAALAHRAAVVVVPLAAGVARARRLGEAAARVDVADGRKDARVPAAAGGLAALGLGGARTAAGLAHTVVPAALDVELAVGLRAVPHARLRDAAADADDHGAAAREGGSDVVRHAAELAHVTVGVGRVGDARLPVARARKVHAVVAGGAANTGVDDGLTVEVGVVRGRPVGEGALDGLAAERRGRARPEGDLVLGAGGHHPRLALRVAAGEPAVGEELRRNDVVLGLTRDRREVAAQAVERLPRARGLGEGVRGADVLEGAVVVARRAAVRGVVAERPRDGARHRARRRSGERDEADRLEVLGDGRAAGELERAGGLDPRAADELGVRGLQDVLAALVVALDGDGGAVDDLRARGLERVEGVDLLLPGVEQLQRHAGRPGEAERRRAGAPRARGDGVALRLREVLAHVDARAAQRVERVVRAHVAGRALRGGERLAAEERLHLARAALPAARGVHNARVAVRVVTAVAGAVHGPLAGRQRREGGDPDTAGGGGRLRAALDDGHVLVARGAQVRVLARAPLGRHGGARGAAARELHHRARLVRDGGAARGGARRPVGVRAEDALREARVAALLERVPVAVGVELAQLRGRVLACLLAALGALRRDEGARTLALPVARHGRGLARGVVELPARLLLADRRRRGGVDEARLVVGALVVDHVRRARGLVAHAAADGLGAVRAAAVVHLVHAAGVGDAAHHVAVVHRAHVALAAVRGDPLAAAAAVALALGRARGLLAQPALLGGRAGAGARDGARAERAVGAVEEVGEVRRERLAVERRALAGDGAGLGRLRVPHAAALQVALLLALEPLARQLAVARDVEHLAGGGARVAEVLQQRVLHRVDGGEGEVDGRRVGRDRAHEVGSAEVDGRDVREAASDVGEDVDLHRLEGADLAQHFAAAVGDRRVADDDEQALPLRRAGVLERGDRLGEGRAERGGSGGTVAGVRLVVLQQPADLLVRAEPLVARAGQVAAAADVGRHGEGLAGLAVHDHGEPEARGIGRVAERGLGRPRADRLDDADDAVRVAAEGLHHHRRRFDEEDDVRRRALREGVLRARVVAPQARRLAVAAAAVGEQLAFVDDAARRRPGRRPRATRVLPAENLRRGGVRVEAGARRGAARGRGEGHVPEALVGGDALGLRLAHAARVALARARLPLALREAAARSRVGHLAARVLDALAAGKDAALLRGARRGVAGRARRGAAGRRVAGVPLAAGLGDAGILVGVHKAGLVDALARVADAVVPEARGHSVARRVLRELRAGAAADAEGVAERARKVGVTLRGGAVAQAHVVLALLRRGVPRAEVVRVAHVGRGDAAAAVADSGSGLDVAGQGRAVAHAVEDVVLQLADRRRDDSDGGLGQVLQRRGGGDALLGARRRRRQRGTDDLHTQRAQQPQDVAGLGVVAVAARDGSRVADGTGGDDDDGARAVRRAVEHVGRGLEGGADRAARAHGGEARLQPLDVGDELVAVAGEPAAPARDHVRRPKGKDADALPEAERGVLRAGLGAVEEELGVDEGVGEAVEGVGVAAEGVLHERRAVDDEDDVLAVAVERLLVAAHALAPRAARLAVARARGGAVAADGVAAVDAGAVDDALGVGGAHVSGERTACSRDADTDGALDVPVAARVGLAVGLRGVLGARGLDARVGRLLPRAAGRGLGVARGGGREERACVHELDRAAHARVGERRLGGAVLAHEPSDEVTVAGDAPVGGVLVGGVHEVHVVLAGALRVLGLEAVPRREGVLGRGAADVLAHPGPEERAGAGGEVAVGAGGPAVLAPLGLVVAAEPGVVRGDGAELHLLVGGVDRGEVPRDAEEGRRGAALRGVGPREARVRVQAVVVLRQREEEGVLAEAVRELPAAAVARRGEEDDGGDGVGVLGRRGEPGEVEDTVDVVEARRDVELAGVVEQELVVAAHVAELDVDGGAVDPGERGLGQRREGVHTQLGFVRQRRNRRRRVRATAKGDGDGQRGDESGRAHGDGSSQGAAVACCRSAVRGLKLTQATADSVGGQI